MHNGVSKRVKDEGIFVEHRIAMAWHLLFLDFAIPLLENIEEKVELFVALVEVMAVELLKLEARVYFRLKEQLDVSFHSTVIVSDNNLLQRCAHCFD